MNRVDAIRVGEHIVCAVREKMINDFVGLLNDRIGKRCVAYFVLCVDVGRVGECEFDGFEVLVECGDVQESVAFFVGSEDVRAEFLEE